MGLTKKEKEDAAEAKRKFDQERIPGVEYWGDSPDHIFCYHTKSYEKKDDYDPVTYSIPKQK